MSTTAYQEEPISPTLIDGRTEDGASGVTTVLGDDSSTEKKPRPLPGPPPPPGTGTGLTSSPSTP